MCEVEKTKLRILKVSIFKS